MTDSVALERQSRRLGARDGVYVSWSGQPSPFLVEADCGAG
ncbi:hypothetical protein ABT316_12990 [Streptomyces cellulosae]